MIAYIKGQLLTVAERSCVLLTDSGLGYELFLTESELSRLPAIGEELELHVLTIVREDAISLYGFSTSEERQLFATLLTVPKLGPRTSLALLNFFAPESLIRVVMHEDIQALSRVPGIGVKTAQRITLDLKDKLGSLSFSSVGKEIPQRQSSAHEETLTALSGLGYAPAEVSTLTDDIFKADPDLDTASAVRLVLKKLARQKS